MPFPGKPHILDDMGPLTLEEIQTQLRDFFRNRKEYKLVGVYGSYSQDKAHAKSDVDICVAQERPLTLDEKIQLSTELNLLLQKEIDLLDLLQAGPVIKEEVLRTCVWIHKDSSFFASFLTRFLVDKEDFGPYYQRMLHKKQQRFVKK
jgi:predicted nucleotidyltransferase